MSLVEDAKKVQTRHKVEAAKKQRMHHPTGFEPGLDTERHRIIGRFERPLDASEYTDAFNGLLEYWGFDPDEFMIEDDRVEVRTWQGVSNVDGPYAGEIIDLWYYKAKVVRKRPVADITELVKRIRARKTVERKKQSGNRTFAVLNGDWQLGKRDGDGTETTIEAINRTIPLIKERYKSLRKQGYEFDTLLIANLGDLIEGCVGHYPMQTFSVELSRREQVRLGRELLTKQIIEWADDFEKVLVVTVPGNHGENRNEDGKSFTNLGDNDDVALVEQVAEAFDLAREAGSSRYEHVRFMIPENELSIAIDVSGTIVGFTHGHAANTRRQTARNLPHTKLWDWLHGQVLGRQPVADCDLLISGHYHYLSLFTQGGRTLLQIPPLDDGSGWFVDKDGLQSMASVATLVIGGGTEDGTKAGWEALHITS